MDNIHTNIIVQRKKLPQTFTGCKDVLAPWRVFGIDEDVLQLRVRRGKNAAAGNGAAAPKEASVQRPYANNVYTATGIFLPVVPMNRPEAKKQEEQKSETSHIDYE